MSQEQHRPKQEPIKYDDVFPVQGELADKPIAPGDAAMMQTAETALFGQVSSGAAAAAMQSAAARNETAGVISHDAVNNVAADQGVTITEEYGPGGRVITETVGGQVVGQYVQEAPVFSGGEGGDKDLITIGESLEAAAISAGEKPVERGDADAIQAAEVAATGLPDIVPGGIAAAAQSAATHNESLTRDEDKIKLTDVLTDVTEKLPSDKVVTREDMKPVAAAEMRNDPYAANMHPTGVAASVAVAAWINENDQRKGDQRTFTNFGAR